MNNRFALALWSRMPSGNLAVSPASISTALTIAWGGAKGETAAQLKRALQLEGEPDALLSKWGELYKALQDAKRSLTLKLANRLYAERGLEVDTTYFTIVRQAFDVWIEPVDFVADAEGARKKINAWVADQTQQRIKDLMPPRSVSADTRFVIVNAIYFLADWAQPFEAARTQPRDFFVDGSKKKQVPTMQRLGHVRHASAGGVSMIELPYKGDSAAMFVLLPDKRDGLAALEKQLEPKLKELQGKLAPQNVTIMLPRFTLDPPVPLQLVPQLQALKIVDAFDPGKADFSNLAKPKDERTKLFISGVVHKAFVKVDEKGTEAAAATAAAAPAGAPLKSIEFRADHPFLFLIVDRASGMILFIGRVTDPA